MRRAEEAATPPTALDWWGLVIDAAASVASIVALIVAALAVRYAWADRPRAVWRFDVDRDHWRERTSESSKVRVEELISTRDEQLVMVDVFAEGTALMRSVHVRIKGAELLEGSSNLKQNIMTRGSSPVTCLLAIPDAEQQQSYVEVLWATRRPLRHHGQRLNLSTEEYETWRWHWWPAPLRLTAKGRWRWLKLWTVRRSTRKGTWVTGRKTPRDTIYQAEERRYIRLGTSPNSKTRTESERP
ncbi:hypothetical protein [Streptomonospora alba]|uniref:hypothetical protein n=1 Tax=Streptomonospora alba TaxID=183763 RepID=UPI00146FEB86|nr:hypothetical protein [Streptomonospora alba]